MKNKKSPCENDIYDRLRNQVERQPLFKEGFNEGIKKAIEIINDEMLEFNDDVILQYEKDNITKSDKVLLFNWIADIRINLNKLLQKEMKNNGSSLR